MRRRWGEVSRDTAELSCPLQSKAGPQIRLATQIQVGTAHPTQEKQYQLRKEDIKVLSTGYNEKKTGFKARQTGV